MIWKEQQWKRRDIAGCLVVAGRALTQNPFRCWHWWHHTHTERVWKIYYSHNEAFRENSVDPKQLWKWVERKMKGDWLVSFMLGKWYSQGEDSCVLFELVPSAKGGGRGRREGTWSAFFTYGNKSHSYGLTGHGPLENVSITYVIMCSNAGVSGPKWFS